MSMIDPITGLRTPINLIGTPTTQFMAAPGGPNPLLAELGNYGSSSLPFAGSATTGLAADAAPAATGALPSIGGAASDIASGAAALAGAGGGGGGAGLTANLMSKLPGFLGGTGTLGSLALGFGVPAGIGLAAKTGVNSILPGSSAGDVVGNALGGAGVGAGIGSLFAPETFGLSTLVGGGIGGLVGAGGTVLANIFGSNSAKDQQNNVAAMAKGFGLDPTQYSSQFNLLNQAGVGGGPKQLALLMSQQMAQDKRQKQAVDEQVAYAQNQHQADLQFGLALQNQMQNFMSPYVNNMLSSGVAQSQVLNNLADQMPSAYKGVFQAQAANALNNAQSTAAAYAGQAAMAPSMMLGAQYSNRQQLQQNNALQTMIAATKLQQGQQGGGGAGATNFANLVQQGNPLGATPGNPAVSPLTGYGQ